ncbi:hypothetical protein OX284_011735 [Flavobacterium sp. SUN046]|uniref:hypothetical protein n=1 Tax=Flavobacterium sp. SUN046 TaxID=3002440 RepID=UPI002DBB03B3|nr:hypothetical protein [Flavobacterium sp. SUN046]MEC4050104.1 hypothetical protein [Flavobacterium sp. SUN046]
MEVILVLLSIAVVGYSIYQYLPNTKFEKAQNLFNAKDYVQAINILNKIFDKHVDAPAKLAECKLNLGKQASTNTEKLKYLNEVVEIRKLIDKTEFIAKFENIEANALFEIAQIQYEEAKGDIDKLNQNIKFIDTANKKGSESNFNSLKRKHFYDLADSYFKKATNKEKSDKLTEAIQCYNIGNDFAEKSDNKKVQNNSITRIAICQLKCQDSISLDNISEIQKSDKNYQRELYYRYAIQLLKSKEYSEAENFISTHLNFQFSEIDKLKEVLNAEKNNNAVKTIAEINNSIEKLYNNTLSIEDLKSLYDNLDKASNEVKLLDKQVSERISAIKPTLFNRLLTQYISREQYGNAITIIQKYPKFWESPELLKNLGICCYGYTSKGLLTERNYRIVISGWLTSVFSDRVILKSLDDTTWDDNYTFSLSEAIGSNYSQHEEMPDNVNYDEISEANISIGATQKELLQQFETIIHKEIQDAKLSKMVNDFYDNEKEAIEKVIEVIENDIFFATPYFAVSNRINNKIIEELDKDYHNYSNENALEAGIHYIKNSKSTVVYQYFFANDLVDKVIIAINNENTTAIKNLNTKENKKWIEKFESISSLVEDKIFNAIANKISEDDENEKLIPVMEECFSFSSQNEKLKHQYSNYVANYCVSKVNDEKIDNFKALTLMKGAYLRAPHNPRVVKNFITLIRFNLMDILNDRTKKTTDIYTILDWVKKNMSQTYKENSSELSKERLEILQQMKQQGIDITLFYNNSISSILSQTSLNSQGLRMKKVLTYLEELGN